MAPIVNAEIIQRFFKYKTRLSPFTTLDLMNVTIKLTINAV